MRKKTENNFLRKKPGKHIAEEILCALRAGKFHPGDQLQGEAELSRIYGESIYDIRKGLALLKKSGVIYSIPKKGVFIAGKKEENVIPPDNLPQYCTPPEDPSPVIRFQTSNTPEFMSGFWKCLEERYAARYPFSRLQYDFIHHAGEAEKASPNPDLRECSGWLRQHQFDDSLLDLSEFCDGTLRLLDRTRAEFIYTSDLLFYNPGLLKKLGLPLPEYETYSGQLMYLDKILGAIRKFNLCTLPGTNQQPVNRLNRILFEMLDDIQNPDLCDIEDFVEKYHKVTTKVTALWKKFEISPRGHAVENLKNFIDEKTPFYFGNNSSWPFAKQLGLRFETGISPLLMADDRMQFCPCCLTIPDHSEHPVESLHLIELLQSPKIQSEFAETGCGFPSVRESLDSLPYLKKNPTLHKAYVSDNRFFFRTKEESYIAMNILNVGLWDVILFEKEPEDVLKSFVKLARLYLKTRLNRKIRERLDRSAQEYD